MRCPYCQQDNDKVIDSRSAQEGRAIRRRRLCLSCKKRYTTYEYIEQTVLKVVKRDGTRVPFDRNKIHIGLERACWKRPISAGQIDELVTRLQTYIEGTFDSEVETRAIGEKLLEYLKEIDEIAFIRYASVYRKYTDIREFIEELKPMLSEEEHS